MTGGVYQDGTSFAHRADPRAKIVAVLTFCVCALTAQGLAAICALGALTIVVLSASGETLRGAFDTFKPFMPLLLFVVMFQVLFTPDDSAWLLVGPISIGQSGFACALTTLVAFSCLVEISAQLMKTTTPQQLVDATGFLLQPFLRKRETFNSVVVGLGIAFRFIPILVSEFERIQEVLVLRLFTRDSQSRWSYVKSSVHMISPLLGRSYESAHTLAGALENRGFDPSAKRTCARRYQWKPCDTIVVLAAILMAGGFIALRLMACA